MRLLAPAVLLLLLSHCTPEQQPAPPPTAPDAPADTAVVALPPEDAPAEEDDAPVEMLYRRTDAELRRSFADALFGLYRMEIDAGAATRLDQAEVLDWLDELESASPRSVALARQEVGDVLEQPAVAALLLTDAHPRECAQERDLLYIAVPEQMQGETRPYDGFIVRDACGLPPGSLCTECVGGAGAREDGTLCSCVCTAGECPGSECVTC